MTSEVAGLTESKFVATQDWPCSQTDVPIALTHALRPLPAIGAIPAKSRALPHSKSSPSARQVAWEQHWRRIGRLTGVH